MPHVSVRTDGLQQSYGVCRSRPTARRRLVVECRVKTQRPSVGRSDALRESDIGLRSFGQSETERVCPTDIYSVGRCRQSSVGAVGRVERRSGRTDGESA